MKIILTGNQGFIGRNLEEELIGQGHDVIGFDVASENGCSVDEIKNAMDGVSVILHQGAITDTLYPDNIAMMKYNYEFSKELFDAAFKRRIKVVYASSAACYGNDNTQETPANIYGWSKYCAEQYGLALYKPEIVGESTGIVPQFIALRYYNVFGPGEEQKGKMSSVAYQAMERGEMVLFPGKPKRDFVYVKDVVSANIHAMNNKYIKTDFYDVGSGVASSFEDVCDAVGISYTHTTEDKIPVGYQFWTESDRRKWLPGWKPKYDLTTALKEYKEHFTEMNSYV
mgnify:FL=1